MSRKRTKYRQNVLSKENLKAEAHIDLIKSLFLLELES
jgi:hypothetical protein